MQKVYPFTDLTGGGSGALDSIDTTGAEGGSYALGVVSGLHYSYRLNLSSMAEEFLPFTIAPDTGDGRWELQGIVADIPAGTENYDAFLVSDDGEVKYRTAEQVLSDIGGAALDHDHAEATTAIAGFMSASDKEKLDEISGTNTGDQFLFGTISVADNEDITASSTSTNLTIVAGDNIELSTNSVTAELTITGTTPLEAQGDMIIAGPSGVPSRLAGGSGILYNTGTELSWEDWADQSVKTDASPIFDTVICSSMSSGYLPYHVSAEVGFLDSPLQVITGGVALENGGLAIGQTTLGSTRLLDMAGTAASLASIKTVGDAAANYAGWITTAYDADGTTANSVLAVYAHGDNRVVSRWGGSVASYAEIITGTSATLATNGLIIGVYQDKPLIFGINNREQARITSSGFTINEPLTLAKADGTAPMVITSTTKVANLNVDAVDDLHAQSLTATSPIVLSGVTSVLAEAGITISHATSAGNVHLPVAGSANQILKNSTAGTAAWGTVTENAGALAAITTIAMSGQLTSTIATGSAPFVIASTTAVTNLNADLLDGYHATGVAQLQGSTLINNTHDLNDISDGWYRWNASSVQPANAPQQRMHLVQITDVQKTQLAFGGSTTGKLYVRRADSGTFYAWTEFWSSANDGAGSGLDADLWDGYQFASYLDQAVKVASSPTFAAVTLSSDPVSAMQAATKQYVDSSAQGLEVHTPVAAATTGNITLSGEQTIDGVSVVAGNRVLVKDQSTSSQNGVYVAASGAWSRATDADAWSELYRAYVWVNNGTAHGDSAWLCTIASTGTLNTDAIVWTQFSSAADILAGTGLTKTGSTISLSHLGLQSLTDPDADRIMFWDDSESALKWLSPGNSISITTTTLDTVQDIRTTASPTFASATLSQETGTAPLTISSTTKVTNLNVDAVDDLHAQTLTATSPITLSGTTSILAAAEITISHATTAGNIHLPEAGSANQILKNSGSAGTGSWGTVTENAGALAAVTTISMSGQLTSTLATGTAPLAVASTTAVANLNADLLDGYHAAGLLQGQTVTVISSANDLDDVADGWYYWNSASQPANGPGVGYMMMVQITSTQKVQFAFGGGTYGKLYVRRSDTGTFYPWTVVWTTSNDGTGSGLDADLWDGNEFATYLNQTLLTTSTPSFAGQDSVSGPVANLRDVTALAHTRAIGLGVETEYISSAATGMTIGTADNINFGILGFTMFWRGSMADWTPGTTVGMLYKYQGSPAFAGYTMVLLSTGVIRVHIGNNTSTLVSHSSTGATGLEDGSEASICAVCVPPSAGVAGSVTFYVNGVLHSVAARTAGAPPTVSSTATLYISGTASTRAGAITKSVALFNRVLTAAEVTRLHRRGIAAQDQWGSQTAAYTSDFSATKDGFSGSNATLTENTDGIAGYDDVLRIVCNASLSTHLANRTTTVLAFKRYRITWEYYIPSANSHVDGVAIGGSGWSPVEINTVQDAWTAVTWEGYTTTTTLSVRLYDGSESTFEDAGGDDVVYVKNIVVTQIGATLALESEGIETAGWKDSSSSALVAAYPATGYALTRKVHAGEGETAHPVATTAVAGFMSATDKGYLDQAVKTTSSPTFATLTLSTVGAGSADYDKFLSLDGTTLKYRTGAQVLSDIGGAESAHVHSEASGSTAGFITLSTAHAWTAAQNYSSQALSSSAGAVAWDVSAKPMATLTMTESTTISAPTNMVSGGTYMLIITHASTYTVSWNAAFKFEGGVAPTLSATAGAVDFISFQSNGSAMRCIGYALDVR